MGIKPVDFIGEKKGALGSHALMKKGLRRHPASIAHPTFINLGSHALMKKGLRHLKKEHLTPEPIPSLGSHALMKKGLRHD